MSLVIQGLSLGRTINVTFGIHSLQISNKVFEKVSFIMFILSRGFINDQSVDSILCLMDSKSAWSYFHIVFYKIRFCVF